MFINLIKRERLINIKIYFHSKSDKTRHNLEFFIYKRHYLFELVIKMLKDLKSINEEFEIFLNKISKEYDKEVIKKAYEFSKKAHAFQHRKTGEPFIMHPLEVAKIVYDLGMDEPSIVAAFLHDVVEDTEMTLEDIRKEFGTEVESIVDGLTKITEFGRKKEDLQIDALRKILLASAKDIRVLIVKLCDRLHNMRTLGQLKEEKQQRIANETLHIYVPIAQKTGLYSIKWELEDLAFKYRNPDMYQFIKNKINLKRAEREQIVGKAVQELKDILSLNDIDNAIVLGRPKNFYSIYKKIKNKAKSFEDILDLYAIRVIAKSISECYTILGVLHDQFQAFPDRLKDYITNPKANGYQSIHTVIYSRSIKCPVEIQIRTEEMHKLAEFGIAAHWRYKSLKEDKKFEKKISWLREVLQWEKEHKDNDDFLNLLKFDFFEDEIFVFTPKNDVILLPESSTVLDFAYAIHTEIGNKAYRAKINGSISTIDKKLKSGDIVEIITNPSVKPSDKWLKIVKTTKAKIKIRDSLNLKLANKRDEEEYEEHFEKLKEKIIRAKEFKKIRKAGCCKIEYGEQIVGVIGKGNEMVVHNASCENAKYTVNEKLPLRWVEDTNKEITLLLHLKDRFGILMDILSIFSEFNLNVSKLNTKVNKDGSVKMTISVLDGPYILALIEKLKELDSVSNVQAYSGFFTKIKS